MADIKTGGVDPTPNNKPKSTIKYDNATDPELIKSVINTPGPITYNPYQSDKRFGNIDTPPEYLAGGRAEQDYFSQAVDKQPISEQAWRATKRFYMNTTPEIAKTFISGAGWAWGTAKEKALQGWNLFNAFTGVGEQAAINESDMYKNIFAQTTNNISDWQQENIADNPIYNTGKFNQSGYWLDQGQQLGTSIVGYMAPNVAMDLALAPITEGMSAAKIPLDVIQAFKGAVVGFSAMMGNRTEGYQTALGVYKDQYDYYTKVLQKSPQEAQKLATADADTTLKFNWLSLPLNITSTAAMFKPLPMASRTKLVQKGFKNILGTFGAEAGQEYGEEVINYLSERAGKRGGYSASSLLQAAFNQEGLEAGFWGALGGAGMTGVTVGKDVYQGNIKTNNQYFQEQQANADLLNSVIEKNGGNPISSIVTKANGQNIILNKLAKAYQDNDVEAVGELKKDLAEFEMLEAFKNGNADLLFKKYNELEKMPPEQLQALGMEINTDPNSKDYYINIIQDQKKQLLKREAQFNKIAGLAQSLGKEKLGEVYGRYITQQDILEALQIGKSEVIKSKADLQAVLNTTDSTLNIEDLTSKDEKVRERAIKEAIKIAPAETTEYVTNIIDTNKLAQSYIDITTQLNNVIKGKDAVAKKQESKEPITNETTQNTETTKPIVDETVVSKIADNIIKSPLLKPLSELLKANGISAKEAPKEIRKMVSSIIEGLPKDYSIQDIKEAIKAKGIVDEDVINSLADIIMSQGPAGQQTNPNTQNTQQTPNNTQSPTQDSTDKKDLTDTLNAVNSVVTSVDKANIITTDLGSTTPNKNGKYYYDPATKQYWRRVTSIVEEVYPYTGPKGDDSITDFGTIAHSIAEDYINGVSKEDILNKVKGNKALESLAPQIFKFIEILKSNGYTIFSEVTIVATDLKGDKSLGGTIDILAVNPKGEVSIIDFKTSGASAYDGKQVSSNYKSKYLPKHLLQLGIYKQALQNGDSYSGRTPVGVNELLIIPIHTDRKSFATVEKSINLIKEATGTDLLDVSNPESITSIVNNEVPINEFITTEEVEDIIDSTIFENKEEEITPVQVNTKELEGVSVGIAPSFNVAPNKARIGDYKKYQPGRVIALSHTPNKVKRLKFVLNNDWINSEEFKKDNAELTVDNLPVSVLIENNKGEWIPFSEVPTKTIADSKKAPTNQDLKVALFDLLVTNNQAEVISELENLVYELNVPMVSSTKEMPTVEAVLAANNNNKETPYELVVGEENNSLVIQDPLGNLISLPIEEGRVLVNPQVPFIIRGFTVKSVNGINLKDVTNNDVDNTAPFKLEPDENDSFTPEDFEAVHSFLKEYLPSVDYKVVEEIETINRNGGKKAWGQFKDAMIYIAKYAGRGTGYHEAFHAVFRLHLTDAEISAVLDVYRKEYNTKDLTDAQVEEKLADLFAEYVITDGKVRAKGNKTASVLGRIWNWFKNLFYRSEIDVVFENITKNKKYADPSLQRTVNRFSNQVAIPVYKVSPDLSYSQNKVAQETVDQIFRTIALEVAKEKYPNKRYGTLFQALGDLTDGEIKDIYTSVKLELMDLLEASDSKVGEENRFAKEPLSLEGRFIVNTVVNNYTDFVNDNLKNLIKKGLKVTGLNQLIDYIETEDKEDSEGIDETSEDASKDDSNGAVEAFGKDPNKSSLEEDLAKSMSKELNDYLSTIPSKDGKNKEIKNTLGFNVYENPMVIRATLYKELSNSFNNIRVFENKLKKLAKKNPSYRKIYTDFTAVGNDRFRNLLFTEMNKSFRPFISVKYSSGKGEIIQPNKWYASENTLKNWSRRLEVLLSNPNHLNTIKTSIGSIQHVVNNYAGLLSKSSTLDNFKKATVPTSTGSINAYKALHDFLLSIGTDITTEELDNWISSYDSPADFVNIVLNNSATGKSSSENIVRLIENIYKDIDKQNKDSIGVLIYGSFKTDKPTQENIKGGEVTYLDRIIKATNRNLQDYTNGMVREGSKTLQSIGNQTFALNLFELLNSGEAEANQLLDILKQDKSLAFNKLLNLYNQMAYMTIDITRVPDKSKLKIENNTITLSNGVTASIQGNIITAKKSDITKQVIKDLGFFGGMVDVIYNKATDTNPIVEITSFAASNGLMYDEMTGDQLNATDFNLVMNAGKYIYLSSPTPADKSNKYLYQIPKEPTLIALENARASEKEYVNKVATMLVDEVFKALQADINLINQYKSQGQPIVALEKIKDTYFHLIPELNKVFEKIDKANIDLINNKVHRDSALPAVKKFLTSYKEDTAKSLNKIANQLPARFTDSKYEGEKATKTIGEKALYEYMYYTFTYGRDIAALTSGNPVFYKSEKGDSYNDWIKRYAEVQTPVKKGNFSRPTTKVLVAKSIEVDSPKEWVDNITAMYSALGLDKEGIKITSQYTGIDSTDAYGMCSIHRYMDIARAKSVDNLEQLEIAYAKMIAGKKLNTNEIAVFKPIKGFHYQKLNINGIQTPFQIKYAITPLTPVMASGNPVLQHIYSNVFEDGKGGRNVDELVFDSAIKAGKHKVQTIDFNNLNSLQTDEANTITIDNSAWGEPLEVPIKDKPSANKGTQIEKKIDENIELDSDGNAYYVDNSGKKIYYTIEFLDGTWGQGGSKGATFELKKIYQSITASLVKEDFDKVVKDLKVELGPRIKELESILETSRTEAEQNELVKLKTEFNEALSKKLVAEFEKRDNLADFYIKGFDITESGDFVMPLDFPGYIDRIEPLVYGAWRNAVSKKKLPGTTSVQVSGFGIDVDNVRKTNKIKSSIGVDNKLNHITYDPITGKIIPAEILVSKDFFINQLVKKGMDTKEIYDILNDPNIFNKYKDIFTGIAYRIPTQGFNSDIPFRIIGFLPDGSFNQVVAPDEFIKQSGSDFDIDKLFQGIRSFYAVDGKLKIAYNNNLEEREGKENAIISYKLAMLTTPYIASQMLSPNSAEDLIRLAEYFESTGVTNQPFRNPYSRSWNNYMSESGRAGKNMTGTWSLHSTAHAAFQTMQLELSSRSIIYKQEIVTGKDVDGNDTYSESTHKLSNLGITKDIEGNFVSKNIEQIQNISVDNAKELKLGILNINNITSAIEAPMLHVGVPLEYTSLFIGTPVIRELVNEIDTIVTTKGYGEDTAYNIALLSLAKKYKINTDDLLNNSKSKDIYLPLKSSLVNSIKNNSTTNAKEVIYALAGLKEIGNGINNINSILNPHKGAKATTIANEKYLAIEKNESLKYFRDLNDKIENYLEATNTHRDLGIRKAVDYMKSLSALEGPLGQGLVERLEMLNEYLSNQEITEIKQDFLRYLLSDSNFFKDNSAILINLLQNQPALINNKQTTLNNLVNILKDLDSKYGNKKNKFLNVLTETTRLIGTNNVAIPSFDNITQINSKDLSAIEEDFYSLFTGEAEFLDKYASAEGKNPLEVKANVQNIMKLLVAFDIIYNGFGGTPISIRKVISPNIWSDLGLLDKWKELKNSRVFENNNPDIIDSYIDQYVMLNPTSSLAKQITGYKGVDGDVAFAKYSKTKTLLDKGITNIPVSFYGNPEYVVLQTDDRTDSKIVLIKSIQTYQKEVAKKDGKEGEKEIIDMPYYEATYINNKFLYDKNYTSPKAVEIESIETEPLIKSDEVTEQVDNIILEETSTKPTEAKTKATKESLNTWFTDNKDLLVDAGVDLKEFVEFVKSQNFEYIEDMEASVVERYKLCK